MVTTDKQPTLRSPRLTARVGLYLGVCVAICFLTGLISHFIQHPVDWFYWPTHPIWLYRVTQGLHVITGVAAIPLLLVKLAIVYPKLFERPVIGSPVRMIERLSIAVLVSAIIFQLATGLLNIAHWYPFKFFFTTTHYAMSYVAIGALLVHIAVKLPIIRNALDGPVDNDEPTDDGGEPTEPNESPMPEVSRGLSRRTVIRGTLAVTGVAALAFAGQTVPFLRWFAFLSPRSGEGPQGVPINRTAAAAGVTETAVAHDYALTVIGTRTRTFELTQLRALPQQTRDLPIACVEGWSAQGSWTGVVLRDLLDLVGADPSRDVRMISLERGGAYAVTTLPANFARDRATLIALQLGGERLSIDHGFPCRLIAPNRPGVLQTKWLSRIEVL